MTIFIKIIISTAIAFFILSCNIKSSNSKAYNSDFQDMPDSIAKRYLDSLTWVIDNSIPLREKGFPINQKGNSYYEERPFFDSLGMLKKVTVYEFQSDSLISYTNYHYWHGQLIRMRNDKAGSGKMIGIAHYIFKNEKLIDSSTMNLPPIPADTLLKKAEEFRIRFERQ